MQRSVQRGAQVADADLQGALGRLALCPGRRRKQGQQASHGTMGRLAPIALRGRWHQHRKPAGAGEYAQSSVQAAPR